MSSAPSETAIAIGPDSAGLLMTPAEFDAVDDYDDNFHYELVNGVLVVLPIPFAGETGPNELLGIYLYHYLTDHPQGGTLDLTLPQQYVKTRNGRRLADRLIWAGLARTPKIRTDVATTAVDFVSAGRRSQRRDYVDKRKEYLAAGIREYWIIDRFQRTLTAIHNRPKRPREQVIGENDRYESPLLPGFEVPLAKLLAAADRLAEAE